MRARRALGLFLFTTACAVLFGCSASPGNSTTTPSQVAAPAAASASQPAMAATGAGRTPADRDQVDEDGRVRRGQAAPVDTALAVSAAMKLGRTLHGKKVALDGTVHQVCAKKGCWWMLAGTEATERVRITAADYGFFVPRNATGMQARAWGTLEVVELSDAEAKHMADDEGVAMETIPRIEMRLVADGLEMRPPQT